MVFKFAIPCLLIFVAQNVSAGDVLINDNFERAETDDSKEQVGGGWGTNSKSRAKGNKQVDLVDGTLHIVRHAEADHGVSLVHEAEFKDARISAKFKLGKDDQLGFNIADMKEKSVHAGHICMAQIRPDRVEIFDMKTGRMQLDRRARRQAGTETAADKAAVAAASKKFKHKLTTDQWHTATVTIVGETMKVDIDGETVGSFTSEGIGHPTKSRLRIAVAKSAWIDDVVLERL